MQTTRGRIGGSPKLPTRVQFRHHQLHAGEFGLGVDVHWNAAAIVEDTGRAIRMQDRFDLGGVPTERLVNGVVDDFP